MSQYLERRLWQLGSFCSGAFVERIQHDTVISSIVFIAAFFSIVGILYVLLDLTFVERQR